MDLRRNETKLTVITTLNAGNAGRAANAWRARHTSSCSLPDRYFDPGSVTTTPRATPCTTPRATPRAPPLAFTNRVSNNTPRRVDEQWINRTVPATAARLQYAQEQSITTHTGAYPDLPASCPTVLLLDRHTFAEPETSSHNHMGSLRRKPHIRRHRRGMSESPRTESVISMPTSPDEWEGNEALTPLMESVIKMYAESPLTHSSSPFRGPGSGETLDSPYSPSVYSMYSDEDSPHKEEPGHQPFVERPVPALHDWDNGVHYRDARVYGVPDGRLLAKKVPTIHLRALLRSRREEAGLPVDAKLDSPDDS
jgi:hypothetical protein